MTWDEDGAFDNPTTLLHLTSNQTVHTPSSGRTESTILRGSELYYIARVIYEWEWFEGYIITLSHLIICSEIVYQVCWSLVQLSTSCSSCCPASI